MAVTEQAAVDAMAKAINDAISALEYKDADYSAIDKLLEEFDALDASIYTDESVIAVDEIGTQEDVHAIDYAMHCGCKMIATVHGKSLDEIRDKPVLGTLIKEKKFERYVVLGNQKGVGSVEGIYDESGRCLINTGYNNNMGN
jgi:uncharacterized protein YdcH (DUF465 family)